MLRNTSNLLGLVLGLFLGAGLVLAVIWVIWGFWCLVVPAFWPGAPAWLAAPGYWPFLGMWILLSWVGRQFFGHRNN